MCLAQGPQRSDASEARTRGLSVSSQALYHWATALPIPVVSDKKIFFYIFYVKHVTPRAGPFLAPGL